MTAWLLDHWDATGPLARDSVVDGAQARATIARLAAVFETARRDRALRARLHWDNGTLAGGGEGAVLDVEIDWPADYVVTCPVRGGFGLFVGELVTNAVRHGRPASQPRVRITCDADNIASIRVIEKNGGTLDAEVHSLERETLIRQYWIDNPRE